MLTLLLSALDFVRWRADDLGMGETKSHTRGKNHFCGSSRMRVSWVIGVPPKHPFYWDFPYKPSSYWGTPIFGNLRIPKCYLCGFFLYPYQLDKGLVMLLPIRRTDGLAKALNFGQVHDFSVSQTWVPQYIGFPGKNASKLHSGTTDEESQFWWLKTHGLWLLVC